jgi:uncharacterized protein with GYD domain
VNREIEQLGGRVVKQWALLGAYDFLSVVRRRTPHHHQADDGAELTRQRELQVLVAIPVEIDRSLSRPTRARPAS